MTDERSQLIEPLDDGEPLAGGAPAGNTADTTVPRRGFFVKSITVALGSVLGLVPLAAGLAVFLDPLRRRRAGGEAPFVRVASAESVPQDGVPRVFQVIADKVDAWNRYLDVPVGSVYLRRDAASPEEVVAFNTTCPHLGCFVESRGDGSYLCPCHKSEFEPDGTRGEPCVSPRGLDRLEAKIVDGEVLVRFQNFQVGTKEKIPV